jgi:hypothetical protein
MFVFAFDLIFFYYLCSMDKNSRPRVELDILQYCLRNKLAGELMVYLYYRRESVNNGGVATRNKNICGIGYRQQLRYLNSLKSLGWVTILDDNTIQLKSLRKIRPELGLNRWYTVYVYDEDLLSLRKFKSFIFSSSIESIARVQRKVSKKKTSSRFFRSPEDKVYSSNTIQRTSQEIILKGIGYNANQLSLSLLAGNLSIPKSSVDFYKKRAIQDSYIDIQKHYILLKSYNDSIDLKYFDYNVKRMCNQYYIRISDEIIFRPSTLGYRKKRTS